MENEDVVNNPLTTGEHRSPSALEDLQQQTEIELKEEVQEPLPEPTTDLDQEEDLKAGDKTNPNLLLKSLKDEREKRRELEAREKLLAEELELIKSSTSSDEEIYSDEGKVLQKKMKGLEVEVASLRKESAKKDLLIQHPILKEHLEAFEEYQNSPDNKGMSIKTAAKAFLIEKGLMETKRFGLERPTGGDKQPSMSGEMTSADAELLRTTNFRKYQEMLMKGQLKIKK